VLPDISTGIHRIDHDDALSPQEKIDARAPSKPSTR
jgi:hypothetical protein